MIVAKFGGSSLADAERFHHVAKIVKSREEMQYIVVSAPGKSREYPCKITDLLYDGREMSNAAVKLRFEKLAFDLGISTKTELLMKQLTYYQTRHKESAITRGEFLSAVLLAALLDYPLIDARDLMLLNDNHEVIEDKTRENIRNLLGKEKHAVIPGFYGRSQKGKLALLPRGGSDYTGSIIAEALDARLYENYTDVSGIYNADPNIFRDAKPLSEITYRELAALASHGAKVLQYESISPCERRRIPIRVCNTFEPNGSGTVVKEKHREDFQPCFALTGKRSADMSEVYLCAIGDQSTDDLPPQIGPYKKEPEKYGALYRGNDSDFSAVMQDAFSIVKKCSTIE